MATTLNQLHPRPLRLLFVLCASLLLTAACSPSVDGAPEEPPTTVFAGIYYVDATATGARTGLSWADAFSNLQPALAAAADGDEIWVAAGTYRPTTGSSRAATFKLKTGVALYGGFSGNETAREQRDWAQHLTVLSGDIGTAGEPADNAYHVVTGEDVDETAVLDGFTIMGGYANGAFPDNRGAGLHNRSASPTVRNCIFRENVVFQQGDRGGFGGGMLNDAGSHPTLTNVLFVENEARGRSGGAGMANKNSSSPRLFDVRFERNAAGGLGGGMTNDGGSSPLLVGVVFRENRAEYTGGMDNYVRARPVLYNVLFEGNVAEEYGGGMTNDDQGDAYLYNVAFVGNKSGNATKAGGAGLHNDNSNPTLVGVTFAGNEAANGAGGLHNIPGSTPVVRNAIFWGNGREIEGTIDLANALVQGGYDGGRNIIDADPRFVSWPVADATDLRLRPESPALDAGDAATLPPDTPDLDGDGDTTEPLPLDLSGAARIVGTAPDLGAYEGPVN